MRFIDETKIIVRSGKGGNGCIAFRREANMPKGGPSGGDGGNGGHVILIANRHANTLVNYRYNRHFFADNGEPGKGSDCHGANGKNIILEVPIGTQVFDEAGNLLIDIDKEGMQHILLRGGRGGLGNIHFKGPVNQAPYYATKGKPATEMEITLNLKILSEVGLVGFPNAGKSSFLRRVSNAKPKVADYPFTTLIPHLGVASSHGREIVIADIPGIIEGASRGIGLGYVFLKHIERSQILIIMLDPNALEILNTYKIIQEELKNYKDQLPLKNQLVVINKADLMDAEYREDLAKLFMDIFNVKVHFISSLTGEGIRELLELVVIEIDSAKAKKAEQEELELANSLLDEEFEVDYSKEEFSAEEIIKIEEDEAEIDDDDSNLLGI